MRQVPLRGAVLAVSFALLAACSSTSSQPPAPPGLSPTPQSTAPRVDTGTLAGAPYRFEIPAGWNGELVVLLHGYEPRGVPRDDPWPADPATAIFLARGYAVAESAYASQGWAVGDAINDSERLRAQVVARHAPKRSWLVGMSMCGLVAIESLERHGAHYDGALSLCGANIPSARVFADTLRSLAAFDVLFPDAGLPGDGLADAAALPLDDPRADQPAVMQAIATAMAGNPDAAARLARALEVSPDALAGTLSLHVLLQREAIARAGGLPVGNRDTVYSGFGDDAAFNAAVRRYDADPKATAWLADTGNLRGTLEKPLVLRYNRVDPTIPPRYQSVYPAMAAAAGRAGHITVVSPSGEGHCAFSPEQVIEAFDVLVRTAG
ncbi:alpha/beta fold hydrolase [Luteimonas terrae]|uniref:Alpha/beta hydrolase n=1 Tax=Luteimonas terrae TaxID=1530191 RepID=A0A4R5U5L5_9GAMM|nr:alpha/beta hydrolase [Luteimonas terrae]TDK29160.1 alpha/beta hydrolase [Luteimonas terrae]